MELRSILRVGIAHAIIFMAGVSDLNAGTVNSADNTDRYFTFQISDKVRRERVRFRNRFGFEICADLYTPKDSTAPDTDYPAIIIGGTYGAVKEQASGLYANRLAEMGYITLAFDPSYTGESSGEPRNMSSPDINTEDFSACVDYLFTRPEVDTSAFDDINLFFTMSSMPVVSSTYWNEVHGFMAQDVEYDLEGLQTMRNLGRNAAFLIKAISAQKEKEGLPEQEHDKFTHFHTEVRH